MADVLVVGSVAWDEVVQLDAPLRAGSHNGGRWIGPRIGGGAANSAMALARAGDRPLLVSALGCEPQGERLGRALAEMGIDCTRLDRRGPVTTRSLVLLEPGGERTIVNLARAAVPLPADLATIPAHCCYVRSADPALTPVLAQRVRQGLVMAHVPPLQVDGRPAQVLVGSASDLDADFLRDPYAAGRRIAGDWLQWMVITYGAEGARAFGDGRQLHSAAPAVEALDGTGAGDVFAAGLAHALAQRQPMPETLALAVSWGSASVRYRGTVPPPGFPEG
jgi:ribokinase